MLFPFSFFRQEVFQKRNKGRKFIFDGIPDYAGIDREIDVYKSILNFPFVYNRSNVFFYGGTRTIQCEEDVRSASYGAVERLQFDVSPRAHRRWSTVKRRYDISQRGTRYQAVILEDHRVLLLRIEEEGEQFWLIPGGGREGSESEEECVVREAREETNLRIEVDRLIFHDKAPPRDPYYRQYKTYLCRIVGGTARPGVEPEAGDAAPVQGIGWFDLREEDSWDAGDASPSFAFQLLRRVRKSLGYKGETE